MLRVNRRTLELFEAKDAQHLVANLDRVFRDAMLEPHLEELVSLWEGKRQFTSQSVNYSLAGKRMEIVVNGNVLPGYEANWGRVLVAIENVTERTLAERQLARSERQLARSERYAHGLFKDSPVSLWVEDFSAIKRLMDDVRARGIDDFRTFTNVHPEFVRRCMQEIRVVDVNRRTLDMFHAPDKATLLRGLDQVFRDEMQPAFAEQLIDLWNGKLLQQREVVNYALDGSLIHVMLQFSVLPGSEESWELAQVALLDITARKKAESYLEYLGKHDVLTQLRNRAYFEDELKRLERKGPWPITVVALDLNGLKATNDQSGHAAGDALLRRAGEVLSKLADKPCCAARIGGDEFVILLPGADAQAGQLVMDSVRSLVELNNQFYAGAPLSLAMGCATAEKGERLENTVSRADERMFADKREYYASLENERRTTQAARLD